MKPIIAFCGGMGSGKDTYGEEYKKLLNKNSVYPHRYSFATPLREEVNILIYLVQNGIPYNEIALLDDYKKVPIEQIKEVVLLIKKELRANKYAKAEDRTPNMRKILQFWGTDVRRNAHENYWVLKAEQQLKEKIRKLQKFYITDARFTNEFDLVKKLGGELFYLDVSKEEQIRRIQERDGITPTIESLTHQSELESKEYLHYTDTINTEEVPLGQIQNKLKEIFNIK